jgi:cobalt-zinc-cadmium efflux system protein
MAHAHHYGSDNERALQGPLVLTTGFLVVEIIGGVLADSLALLSDAAHMFTDTAALAIALAATRVARRPVDARRTFGYHRFEILAAAYILWEAWQRLHAPAAVKSGLMLWVAVAGLVVNLIGMRLLSGGKESNLNVKGAYLEVWSDMLGSLGVIAGALVIRFTGWAWVDSVVAVAIALWVLPRTGQLLHESLNVLLEGVPEGLDLGEIERGLRGMEGVADVHDLHVWSIASGKASLSVHVVCTPMAQDGFALMHRVRELAARRWGLHHATVQVEREPCAQADAPHAYGPATDLHAGHAH